MPERRVAAVVLAAGSSRRFGGPNKLVADLDGKPVVRRGGAGEPGRFVIVVPATGGRGAGEALAGLDVRFVTGDAHAKGCRRRCEPASAPCQTGPSCCSATCRK
ncbi:MAG: NTP transferase domain-containing protein [Hyphomicrobiales bacterium]